MNRKFSEPNMENMEFYCKYISIYSHQKSWITLSYSVVQTVLRSRIIFAKPESEP
jgi:hypothetical protein